MSQGIACQVRGHQSSWVVLVRNANYSAFNGGRRTPSAYSSLQCKACKAVWRTKAAYVKTLPDTPQGA